MTLRLAALISHPIQTFAPWYREVARLGDVDLRVFYCCDWGLNGYRDPGFGELVRWDIPLVEGYEHEFLPIARPPVRLRFWDVDNPGVGEALDRFDPQVLLVHGYAHRTNWRAARWAKRRRTPLLLYSDSNVREPRRWWEQATKQPVVRSFYRLADGAFCVGDNNVAYHLRYGLPRERLFPGMMPIDRERLLAAVGDRDEARRRVRERFGVPTDAFVVLMCGKYGPRKRPLDTVVAAAGAAAKGLPVWAMLVGEGPERAAIEAHCRRENVRNAVLTGFVNQSSIPDFYAAADALALTSQREGYGLVIGEAAVFGLPIIASDLVGCVGPNDMAQHGVNAIVYPCGDTGRLQEAIETLYGDPALRGRMAAASARLAEARDLTAAARAIAAAAAALDDLGPRRTPWARSGSTAVRRPDSRRQGAVDR